MKVRVPSTSREARARKRFPFKTGSPFGAHIRAAPLIFFGIRTSCFRHADFPEPRISGVGLAPPSDWPTNQRVYSFRVTDDTTGTVFRQIRALGVVNMAASVDPLSGTSLGNSVVLGCMTGVSQPKASDSFREFQSCLHPVRDLGRGLSVRVPGQQDPNL